MPASSVFQKVARETLVFSSPEPKAPGKLIGWNLSLRTSVCPHFQRWKSLTPAGRLKSNFIWSIIGVGETLHKILVQIRPELCFPWQQIAPIRLYWGKSCDYSSPSIFDWIFFILAGNECSHKISNRLDIQQDPTRECGVSCPSAFEKFPIDS